MTYVTSAIKINTKGVSASHAWCPEGYFFTPIAWLAGNPAPSMLENRVTLKLGLDVSVIDDVRDTDTFNYLCEVRF